MTERTQFSSISVWRFYFCANGGEGVTIQNVWALCHQMLAEEWGYIYGASGQIWTQAKQDATDNDMAQKYGQKWVGHHVADCSGVMVYIWKQFGLSIYHGSNTIARKHCGQLSKEPKAGYAAFKVNGDDYYHIGIVDENNEFVYESRSTQAGFKHDSPVSKWQWFAPFTQVDYKGEQNMGEPLYSAEVVTQSGRLNVRAGAGTNYPVIGQLEKGEEVGVYGITNGWAQILFKGIDGFVSNQYLRTKPPDEAPIDQKYSVVIECPSEVDANLVASLFKNAAVVRGGLK